MWIRTAVMLALLLGPAVAHGEDMYGEGGMHRQAVTPSSPAVDTPPGTMDAGNSKSKCEEQWKRYRASQECFAPYRLADGGIKAEAFKHCTVIKQPDFCK